MAQGPSIIPQQDNKAPMARLAFNLPEPTTKSMFSLKYWRLAVRRINALLNMQSVDAGKVGPLLVSDSNTILPVAAGTGTTTTGTGNMRYMYNVPETAFTAALYDATLDYAVYDVVYTNPDGNTRISWVCEIANGPHQPAGAQAPTWPEPGTVYWRALARFFFNSASGQQYRPGLDGDTLDVSIDGSGTGDVMVVGGFHMMDMTDSALNTTYALRNIAVGLTTYLSPKPQHWWTPANGGISTSGLCCVYNGSGQCFVGASGDLTNDVKWNDVDRGNPTGSMVLLNADGTVDTTFAPTTWSGAPPTRCALDGFGNVVYVTQAAQTKKLLAASGAVDGGFAVTGSPACRSIIPATGNFWVGIDGSGEGPRPILGSNGSTIGGFTSAGITLSGSGVGTEVWDMALPPGGDIIIVGKFDAYGGTTRSGFARIDFTGTLQSQNPTISGGYPRAIYAQQDGKYIIGGDFDTVNSTTRHCLARLNSDGTLDTGWNCGCDGQIYRIAQNSRGETIVVGKFTHIGGSGTGSFNRRHVARIDANGNVLGI